MGLKGNEKQKKTIIQIKKKEKILLRLGGLIRVFINLTSQNPRKHVAINVELP